MAAVREMHINHLFESQCSKNPVGAMLLMSTLVADAFAHLESLRNPAIHRDTVGLKDSVIRQFLSHDEGLSSAIAEAVARRDILSQEFGEEMMTLPESELVKILQSSQRSINARA